MKAKRFVPSGVTSWTLLAAWVCIAGWAWSRPVPLTRFETTNELESVGFRLPINTADRDDLIALHGIGPALAQRIVDHREQHGPIVDSPALQDISGIGPRIAARISPWLTFE